MQSTKILLFAISAFVVSCATQSLKESNVSEVEEARTETQETNDPLLQQREKIRAIVMENREKFWMCYDSENSNAAKPGGKVVLEWNVRADGLPSDEKVLSFTVGDSKLHSCLIDKLRTLKFPAPPSLSEVTVRFPFYFDSSRSKSKRAIAKKKK